MGKTNRSVTLFHLFLISLFIFYSKPNYAGVSYGSLSNLPKSFDIKEIKGDVVPRGLNNSALLNLESALLPSEIVFNSAYQIGGSAVTQIGGTAIDADGNHFITGGFTGTINIGEITLTSSGGYDFYIAKLDPSGNVLWARATAGSSALSTKFAIEGGIAIAVDKSGDCYVGGSFVKSMSFLSESGDTIVALTDGRNDDNINFEVFVAKYNSSGDLMWAQGGNSGSSGALNNLGIGLNTVNCLILDNEDYPYIGGRYSGTSFLETAVTPKGGGDFFVASLDPDDGTPYWISMTGTGGDDLALSLSVDHLGYINVLGSIGPGEITLPDTTLTYTNETGSNDTFIISYDINGQWYFASIIGGGEDIVANDIASDSIGNIYVTGEFSNVASFAGSDLTLVGNEQFRDGYIAKYDLNGNTLWVRQFGSIDATRGNRIVVDENSNSYIVGVFSNQAVFGVESPTPVTLTSNSSSDMFVVKYDSSGTFMWVKQIDGGGTEGLDLIASVDVPVSTNPIQLMYSKENDGELIISGDFNNVLSLDNLSLSAGENSRSGFVANLAVLGNATDIEKNNPNLNNEFSLSQNYPNPFNPTTTLTFSLSRAEVVKIDIFNSIGQKVETLANSRFTSGRHQVVWDATGMASGLYFYSINSGKFRETKKMTLLK